MDKEDMICCGLIIVLFASIVTMMHADTAPIGVGDKVYTSENYEYFEGVSFEGTVTGIHGSHCIVTNESGVNQTLPAGALLKDNPLRPWRVSTPHLFTIR